MNHSHNKDYTLMINRKNILSASLPAGLFVGDPSHREWRSTEGVAIEESSLYEEVLKELQ